MKVTKTLNLRKNRHGVSAVISNIILIAAVISIGFIVLVWSQTQSANYTNQYGNAIQSDTDQLRERVAFEYIHYNKNTGTLTVYLMNSGTIGNVNITNVFINNAAYDSPQLHLLSNNAQIDSLNATQEGYFSISPTPTLAPGTNYPITIVTWRGSSFVATFAT